MCDTPSEAASTDIRVLVALEGGALACDAAADRLRGALDL
jgi:hypothetical protein